MLNLASYSSSGNGKNWIILLLPIFQFQMIEYNNGYYQGELNNSKREGFGVFYWDSGQIYIGKWNKDYMEDQGVVYFSEGGCAYGNFHRNKLNGYASITDTNGNMIVGHFQRGILENGVWNEKLTGKWFKYDIQNQEVNRDIELTTKSQIPQIFSLKEMIKKLFHECNEYQDTTWYVGVTNDNGRISSGLGIMIDSDNKVLQVGYFKGKKLNGFGRQYLGFMINDGIFDHQEFKYGTQFFVRDKKFFYGFFSGNQIKKIIKSGTGYPSYLLSYYKHPSKYANSKIDKAQEQEVMQDLQNKFMYKYSSLGYNELFKNSPKKKNLQMFVENKYSEDFISPQGSVYQEVLEAAKHAKLQREQYSNSSLRKTSFSPMNKKELQLQEGEYNNYSLKQLSSKISPSSSSSYTPSNLRLQTMTNYRLRQSNETVINETEKKKSKSIDFMQQNSLQTGKKSLTNQNSQFQRNSQHDISRQSQGSLKNNFKDSSEHEFQNTNQQSTYSSGMAQKVINQIKKKSLNFNEQNERQSIKLDEQEEENKQNNKRQSSDQRRESQASQQQLNVNKNIYKKSLLFNKELTEEDSIKNNKFLTNTLQKQLQLHEQLQNSIQNVNNDLHMSLQESIYSSKQSEKNQFQFLKQQNNEKNSNNQQFLYNQTNNQLGDQQKQIQELQEIFQSFNGFNDSLNQNLYQSIKQLSKQKLDGIQPNDNKLKYNKNETPRFDLTQQFINGNNNQYDQQEKDEQVKRQKILKDRNYQNQTYQNRINEKNQNENSNFQFQQDHHINLQKKNIHQKNHIYDNQNENSQRRIIEEEEVPLSNQNSKIVNELTTPNSYDEDLIKQSENQNNKIIQKLQDLNKIKQFIKKDESDSFECNINQESQLDFIDSSSNNIKSEDYYKSLLSTIPENIFSEQNTLLNSDNNKMNQQSLSLNLNQFTYLQQKQQNNQIINNNTNNASLSNNFIPFNQQSIYDDIQYTTIEDDDEERKTKFKYINESPYKKLIQVKKRKKIFDTPINNSSFNMKNPSINKILQSPQANQLDVIIPSNNIQQISEFNINNLLTQQNQNKQEFSPDELSELYQFQKEKNNTYSINSFNQINLNENQFIFNNPQQEYTSQNINNYQSNNQGIRQKPFNSTQNHQYQSTNPNVQQLQSSNPNINKSEQAFAINNFYSLNNYKNSDESGKALQFFQIDSGKRQINGDLSNQLLEPIQNTQLSNTQSLRQIMNKDKDICYSPIKRFNTENAFQHKQSNLLTNSSCQPVQSFKYISESENKEQYNNARCSFSRNLKQSFNELHENSSASSFKQKYNTQNDFQQNEGTDVSLKDLYESNQKNNNQFQPVMRQRSQIKKNASQQNQLNYKQRSPQLKLNINLSDISNEKLTPKKANPRSLNTPSSQKTISMSTLQKISEQKQKSEGILDQFISEKNNQRNQYQSSLHPEFYDQSSYLSLNHKQFS